MKWNVACGREISDASTSWGSIALIKSARLSVIRFRRLASNRCLSNSSRVMPRVRFADSIAPKDGRETLYSPQTCPDVALPANSRTCRANVATSNAASFGESVVCGLKNFVFVGIAAVEPAIDDRPPQGFHARVAGFGHGGGQTNFEFAGLVGNQCRPQQFLARGLRRRMASSSEVVLELLLGQGFQGLVRRGERIDRELIEFDEHRGPQPIRRGQPLPFGIGLWA